MILAMNLTNLSANENKKTINDLFPVLTSLSVINKVEMKYQGVDGFWISKWFADEILKLQNDLEKAQNTLIEYTKGYDKLLSKVNRQQFIITGLCIALGTSIGVTIVLAAGIGICALIIYSWRQ